MNTVTIVLTQDDLVRLGMIKVDRDAEEALTFIQERILPEIQRQEAGCLKGPLDGGRMSLR